MIKIFIQPNTQSRINHLRDQLPECSPSSSFDDTLQELVAVADDHPGMDLNVEKQVEQIQ